MYERTEYVCIYPSCGKKEPHSLAMADHTRRIHGSNLSKARLRHYWTDQMGRRLFRADLQAIRARLDAVVETEDSQLEEHP